MLSDLYIFSACALTLTGVLSAVLLDAGRAMTDCPRATTGVRLAARIVVTGFCLISLSALALIGPVIITLFGLFPALACAGLGLGAGFLRAALALRQVASAPPSSEQGAIA